jgi:DNA-binding transcriptional regulator YdaS (Cro superfamily)
MKMISLSEAKAHLLRHVERARQGEFYQKELRDRLDAALKTILHEEKSQSRVEQLLGISPGYLSKLKLGKRQPSAEFVSMLALVSKSPKRRLAELDKFYRPQDGRKRAAG